MWRGIGSLATAIAVVAHGSVVQTQQAPRESAGVAYLAVDLSRGATLASERADRLDIPALPGSLIKIATLAAALESGAVGPRSGILCARRTMVAGHTLVCTHPELQRALQPAEALAHSCNTFFTTVGGRTPRSAIDRALVDLGLPPTDPAVPIAGAAVGLEGMRVAPRRFIAAIARIAEEPSKLPWKPETLATVREGLRGAAAYGTARALGDRGITSMAKTGTVINNGIAQGLVVGVTRSSPSIGFVLMVSGGAGLDAAALAANRLAVGAAARGRVRLGLTRPDGTYEVRVVSMDDYVANVVAGEAAVGSSAAALEALAITVRTYTEANRGRHAADGFDLCDLTHCQVPRRATPATTRAAKATTDRVLLDHGAVAHVFYTASCGGHAERPSRVWRGAPDPAFLQSRPDSECAGQPVWTSDVNVRDLQRALAVGHFEGETLRNISVMARTPSGRAEWLRLDGLVPDQISGEDLRTLVGRTLGWQYLKSTLFDVRRTSTGFRFNGHGAGHGVGLCVIGSAALASSGGSTPEILSRYFPGLTLGAPASAVSRGAALRAPSTSIQIVLGPSNQPEAAVVRDLASRRLVSLSTELAVALPERVVLRFHPTVESYQRETRQRWFTAASTHGTTVDLLPLSTLKRRGILESTLAHELVHVLTAATLVGRPLWVAEGVASYFAGEHSDAPLAACPADAQLQTPSSPDVLRRALEDATACVAAQLRTGKSWRMVR